MLGASLESSLTEFTLFVFDFYIVICMVCIVDSLLYSSLYFPPYFLCVVVVAVVANDGIKIIKY